MDLSQIAGLGRKLLAFLRPLGGCFGRQEPRDLLRTYVQGQLSSLERKSVEPIALQAGIPPRTLQRFLESIEWDEELLRDRCQQLVAADHADPQAIGVIDESGMPKSGRDTVGVERQWCGRTGKVDNCVVVVHVGYVAPNFHCLLDSELYLPRSWADDRQRREKAYVPEDVQFRTKPQIALDQVDRALSHGIQVAAWNFDELYGRDTKFLDGLDERKQTFVGEVPANFHGWLRAPRVLSQAPKNASRRARRRKYPRRTRRPRACEVQNLVKYSVVFRKQTWKRFYIKDSQKGPVVWEVKRARFYRKQSNDLPSEACCLIVARNVLNPKEVKYFLANVVPLELDSLEEEAEEGVKLTWLLWVAFRRWPIEQCFRQAKNELGLDHFEVRGWRCVHRHLYLTQLSLLFCARVRQEYAATTSTQDESQLTVEQVRDAMDAWLQVADLPPALREARWKKELTKMHYHQRRNKQAEKSHTKTRLQRLDALGIQVDQLECCIPTDTG